MITHLMIHNLAVVQHLELEIKSGMTVLTGETGAGKSILIDALQLALGERADSSIVRHGASSAEISAGFELNPLPQVKSWLQEHALDAEGECIIRRTLTEDGKSRAYINGHSVPLNQLRELGEQLVNIHGQHQHQSLLKSEHQRYLLDEYANHPELCEKVRLDYLSLQRLQKEFQRLHALQGQNDKIALLQYQIQEIVELNLQDNELELLSAEQKELAHIEQWQASVETALNSLKNDSGQDAISALYQAMNQINSLKTQTNKLNTCHEFLSNALIQLEEAVSELEGFKENLNLDPTRLVTVEERLSQIYALARKHRVQPEIILEHKQKLLQEATLLIDLHENLTELKGQIELAEAAYQASATALSKSRTTAALQLEKLITTRLKTLEMPNGQFKIEFLQRPAETISINGLDHIEFLVSTNPGLPLQPMRKIASGGELSRISLAIQVITAQKTSKPTLIFDEVDAGISGKTADTVGKLLRKLSADAQVLCVTHLPQIAAMGHHHYKVEKTQTKNSTTTHIFELTTEQKVQELARMLGGATITKHALLHAKEMLETSE